MVVVIVGAGRDRWGWGGGRRSSDSPRAKMEMEMPNQKSIGLKCKSLLELCDRREHVGWECFWRGRRLKS